MQLLGKVRISVFLQKIFPGRVLEKGFLPQVFLQMAHCDDSPKKGGQGWLSLAFKFHSVRLKMENTSLGATRVEKIGPIVLGKLEPHDSINKKTYLKTKNKLRSKYISVFLVFAYIFYMFEIVLYFLYNYDSTNLEDDQQGD